jgi:hypothetical protein
VWNHYDTDGNGYIEGEELDGFLREFVSSVNPDHEEVRPSPPSPPSPSPTAPSPSSPPPPP